MKSKWPEEKVKSAGVFAGKGEPMAGNSEVVLREKDLTLDHETSQITEELLEWADLVLAMTDRHKQTLTLQYPNYDNKYYTLKEYVLIDDRKWQALKESYSTFEEKRSHILREGMDKLDQREMEEKLNRELEEDMHQIEEMERGFPDINISDPFGGNVNIYRETRDELEKHIELLVRKLENRDN